MGQIISINKNNLYKTHRFTDNMYVKFNEQVDKNEKSNMFELHFRDTMKPVFENNLNIPIYYCTYIQNGYCIIARRLSNIHIIEIKGIQYNNHKSYTNFTKGYARLAKIQKY